MKRPQRASLARSGGALALALACTFAANHVEAVPYASMIRFGEPALVGPNLNVDMSYTLNEDADSVTVELYNNNTASVVRTYPFTSPDVETTRGRHTITWDGYDDAANPVVVGGNEFVIRVNVKKFETTNEWTLITNNSSGLKATEQTSIFNGYSPNDLRIPLDPNSDQFGLLLAAHSYNAAQPAGIILLGTDLEPIIGDGGGAAATKGQHTAAPPGSQAVWKMHEDPINPDLMWWAGQTAPAKIGVFNISAQDPNDIQSIATNAWTTDLFPRGFAVGTDSGSGDRVGFLGYGNNVLDRATMGAAYPHAITANTRLTTTDPLDGSTTNYVQDVKLDALGNVYVLIRNRTATIAGEGRIFRWNRADVEAAPGVVLTDANMAWLVRVPAGSSNFTALHVDQITGEVYAAASAGTPRGVFRVGNASDATLASKPYTLLASDLILNFDDLTQFPVGYAPAAVSVAGKGQGISTDRYGNLYVTHRPSEEIHSFSPPHDDVQHDITTQSPGTLTDSLLLIELESFSATSTGVGSPAQITWTTSSEIDNVGFRVRRIRFEGGAIVPAGPVSNTLIPAAGQNGGGATYNLLDPLPIGADENRGYFLIDIDSNGNDTRHGPFRVQVGPGNPTSEKGWMLY